MSGEGVGVYETTAELAALDELLRRSRDGATAHLRGIIGPSRTLGAADLASLLTGMRVLALATVTAHGEPRVSAVDGHFLHGSWTWGTSGTSAKARHLERRPAVSVAHIDGEALALFAHGEAERLVPHNPRFDETLAHWTAHYGSSPLDWGPDTRLYRLAPAFMVGYASDRDALLARRAGSGEPDGGGAAATHPG